MIEISMYYKRLGNHESCRVDERNQLLALSEFPWDTPFPVFAFPCRGIVLTSDVDNPNPKDGESTDSFERPLSIFHVPARAMGFHGAKGCNDVTEPKTCPYPSH